MAVPPKIIVEDTRLIADEITRTAENVPNVSVTAIEVVRRQGPPNARTQAQKCLLTTQHSSYYKSIHIVIAKINVQNSKPSRRQLPCSKRKFRMPVAA